MMTYEFHDRLIMSQGVAQSASISKILLSEIPGALSVTKATDSQDRSGTDWWVGLSNKQLISIDCKVREKDCQQFGNDDLALETWSVIEKNIPGWTRDLKKRTDYVLWLWTDTCRWCLVPFRLLCAVFDMHWEKWKEKYKNAKQCTPTSNGSYHSECVFVPRVIVWRAIYVRFSGTHIATNGERVER